MIKHWPKTTWARNCLFWLKGYSQLSREAEAETKPGPQRTAGHWLLSLVCPVTFLTQPRSTSLGMAPPTVGWALLCQLAIKKMPQRLVHRPISWKKFLSWGSFPGALTTLKYTEEKKAQWKQQERNTESHERQAHWQNSRSFDWSVRSQHGLEWCISSSEGKELCQSRALCQQSYLS